MAQSVTRSVRIVGEGDMARSERQLSEDEFRGVYMKPIIWWLDVIVLAIAAFPLHGLVGIPRCFQGPA